MGMNGLNCIDRNIVRGAVGTGSGFCEGDGMGGTDCGGYRKGGGLCVSMVFFCRKDRDFLFFMWRKGLRSCVILTVLA